MVSEALKLRAEVTITYTQNNVQPCISTKGRNFFARFFSTEYLHISVDVFPVFPFSKNSKIHIRDKKNLVRDDNYHYNVFFKIIKDERQ
jgi:hypothetical protein